MLGFSWTLDAPIVGFYLLVTMAAGLYVRRYVSKVDDFLLAGREMNVYLGIASLAATEFGIITCMYAAELGYNYGFSGAILGILSAVSMLGLGLTGFCIRPLRDAGVRTLPELFERRFGPRIRWAAGVVIVLGGLLNMGVFLRVAGEFLVLACGLDPAKLEITMTVLLVLVAVYTLLGGMLSVLVTDFLQFVVMSIGLLAVSALVLDRVGWETLVETVRTHHGEGGLDPLRHPKMGWQYVVFQSLVQFSAVLTWQTTIARVLAAKDSRTGRQVYTRTSFFFVCRFLIPVVWGIAALALVTDADFSPALAAGFDADKKSLYAMPIVLGKIVPAGLMGLMVAAMLAADMSTDSSYMLTWGSVIYNDILAPFRRVRSERRGLLWNRMIVGAIGVYLLLFGLWFTPKGDLWSYLAVTGTVYMSSVSTLLVACCYWPRANSRGAAAAIVVGAVMPITHLLCQHSTNERLAEWAAAHASLWGIATYAACALAMIAGSLTKRADPLSSTS